MTEQAEDYEGREMTFRIMRYDPDKDSKPYFQQYKIKLQHGMTILDALMHIKETQDPTLSYRKSCRMGICGSCAMQVNGLPVLTCQTQVVEISTESVEVRPLANYPVIRDLVPDLGDLMARHESVLPYIIRQDDQQQRNPSGEYSQSPDELEQYLQFAYCIKCGSCLAACPTNATDRKFTGPQALAAAYRYAADSRDGGLATRLDALDHPNSLFRCHYAGACSEACPKGVDPSLAIQLLKRELFKNKILGRAQKPAGMAQTPAGVERREGIPQAPEKTV